MRNLSDGTNHGAGGPNMATTDSPGVPPIWGGGGGGIPWQKNEGGWPSHPPPLGEAELYLSSVQKA